MRRYVAIQPSDTDTAGDIGPSGAELLVAKRRRIGVSVACNACRRKKIRVCLMSRVLVKTKCPDDSELSQESRVLLIEVIRLLNGVPDEEAVRRLRELRKEIDTSVIMSTLRQVGDPGHAPREKSISTHSMGDSFQILELAPQNPNAYLPLTDMNWQTLQEATYQQLIQPACHKPEPGPHQAGEEGVSDSGHGLCDSRLAKLNITEWTDVSVTSELAAHAISLYLETDHPLLGFFEPDLFIRDLVNGGTVYCSSLLVNSLLYWACQMNNANDPGSGVLAFQFCQAAERLWQEEKHVDSLLNVAAVLFLSIGYLGHGRNHAVLSYLSNACHMAVRMRLFGVGHDLAQQAASTLSPEARRAHTQAAWGAFNWATHMSLFYRQPGLSCPESPPVLPPPGDDEQDGGEEPAPPDYMGGVFPYLCRFWSIVHEVALLSRGDGGSPAPEQQSLRFVEYKFRELLAWSNGLPYGLSRGDQNPHYVQVLHIWFHTAILDLFRHVISGPLRHERLPTFAMPMSSSEKVYEASVSQLKQLIVNYRLNFTSSSYTILWHVALTYLANAVLYEPKEENWLFYFLLCVYGYERLRPSWRVTKSISTALLSLALRKGDISSPTARRILSDIEQTAGADQSPDSEGIRATFMADLHLARSDPQSATVERLADDFEANILLQEYTNAFGADDPVDH
ncbi:uncharacterized protein MAM_05378 [Metarhizium album ARSEF 1941]|uniref:N-terminal fungal transcription regulatory domain-containing protein n=1 Tax=Metarhizium album (strain ARSEF 1941) TaxID=1081103 RepID=A0A0B2WTN3_METAS|nr:uncharacterized protein MAM_05378 [Metarhizium album ARSEF 1941]KHN96822.1 hypothetical protein MAM_05378 [Metarhizium album ARSEF 1941]